MKILNVCCRLVFISLSYGVKPLRFESLNVLCDTGCNFSGRCSFWCCHVTEVWIHLPENSGYRRIMQPCNEVYECYCIYVTCLQHWYVCQMCKQHAVWRLLLLTLWCRTSCMLHCRLLASVSKWRSMSASYDHSCAAMFGDFPHLIFFYARFCVKNLNSVI